ncbi:MAG: histidinol dehydrogenase [Odoribacter splanchnicus]|nr:histidinol dehydrogenase [Odoribacter splanchnicus]
MEKIINPVRQEWAKLLARPKFNNDDLVKICKDIFAEVMRDGDKALAKYTLRFDRVSLENIAVTEEEFDRAEQAVGEELKEAIREAKRNIEAFHILQKPAPCEYVNSHGFRCWQEAKGIEKVGLYIPGGSAPLFSTVLMLAVPARIAGCREIILCTPPNRAGAVEPAILWTARLCGVTRVYKVGGVQAIGAMTLGTETVPQVYKIFGPGNQYVTAAKQLACNFGVAIDMPAGLSEVMVVADRSANPAFIAADLLSQAEHGPDSQVVLVTPDAGILPEVEQELEAQLAVLPRKEIAVKALANSKFVVLADIEQCMELVNEYAPEHLILCVEDYREQAKCVVNAGSVFLGNYSPESAGDYASGTNHTLPTNGYAKAYSGVNLDAFIKKITFQEISREGLGYLGRTIEIMAENEQLFAHKNAVTLRITNEK